MPQSSRNQQSVTCLFISQIDSQALGAGASGSVRRAVHKPSGRVIALKSINIADKSKRDQVVCQFFVCLKCVIYLFPTVSLSWIVILKMILIPTQLIGCLAVHDRAQDLDWRTGMLQIFICFHLDQFPFQSLICFLSRVCGSKAAPWRVFASTLQYFSDSNSISTFGGSSVCACDA